MTTRITIECEPNYPNRSVVVTFQSRRFVMAPGSQHSLELLGDEVTVKEVRDEVVLPEKTFDLD